MQLVHDLIPYRSIIPQKLKSQNQTTVLQKMLQLTSRCRDTEEKDFGQCKRRESLDSGDYSTVQKLHPRDLLKEAALTPEPGAIKQVEAGPRGEQMLGQADPWVADGSDISKVTGLAKQK